MKDEKDPEPKKRTVKLAVKLAAGNAPVLFTDGMMRVFEEFEKKNQMVIRIDMCASMFRRLRNCGRNFYDENSRRFASTGFLGSLFTADLFLNNRVKDGSVLCHVIPFKLEANEHELRGLDKE